MPQGYIHILAVRPGVSRIIGYNKTFAGKNQIIFQNQNAIENEGIQHLIIIHSGSVLLRDRSKEDNECPIVMPHPL